MPRHTTTTTTPASGARARERSVGAALGVPTVRERIAAHLKALAPKGATRGEIAEALGLNTGTVNGRVHELLYTIDTDGMAVPTLYEGVVINGSVIVYHRSAATARRSPAR